MKLISMTIENFRSIKKCNVFFNELTGIVGENNAGKTAVLRALNSVFNFDFEAPFFLDGTHQYAPRTVTRISLTFNDVPKKNIYDGKKDNSKLSLIFQYSYGNTTRKKSLYYQIQNIKTQLDDSFLSELKKDIDFVYIPANRSSKDLTWTSNSIFQRLITTYLREYTKNRDTLSQQVIRAAHSIKSHVLTRLDRELSELNMSDINGQYQIDFATQIDYTIFLNKLGINIEDAGITLPVIEYGSGIKSLTVIALHRMYAKQNNVNIILGIEEPETNLHPQAQKKLIASLKSNRQNCETQAIFATHSPVIIDELDHQDIILVRREKDEKRGFHSIATQLSPNFWEEHNITELKHYNFFKYKNSEFFFSKYVILTESITDAQVIEKLLLPLLGEKIYNISILNLDGVKNLKYPFFLLRDLGIPFSAVIDKDFFTQYKQGSLAKSRDITTSLPLYSNTLNTKNPVIKYIFNSESSQNELESRLSQSYTKFLNFLKPYGLLSMQYCLEMDLVASPIAANLYYNYFNLENENRVPSKLLIDRKDSIKDPSVLLNIVEQLRPLDYPISFKKIRAGLLEAISPYL